MSKEDLTKNEQLPSPDVGSGETPHSEAPPSMEPPNFRVTYQFGLNLRAEPSYEAEVLKVIPCGTQVAVVGDAVPDDDTIWVQTEGGWVDSRFLEMIAEV